MLEQLDVQPGHRVLEIGAGTGYNAALLAQIVGESGEVVAVDIDDDIVEAARAHLAAAGFERVRAVRGDGGLGFPEAAPFDRIILTVAATDISPAWREQLAPGGRLLMPLRLGGILTQKIVAFEPAEHHENHLETVSVRGGWFIMLRGAHAQAQSSMALGEETGLELWADEESLPAVEPAALSGLLTGPGQDWPTGVLVNRSQFWGGLLFWLGVREPRLCQMVANHLGIDADRRRWPIRQVPSTSVSTVGVVGEDGLALLAGPPVTTGDVPPADRTEPYEILVRSYGDGDEIARRLVEHITAWEAAGRPSGEGLRIRAYPALAPSLPAGPGEIVVQKRHSRLVLDWP
jgi:protein-L-isoaspartate(D-aspartate) O-methyltransferase